MLKELSIMTYIQLSGPDIRSIGQDIRPFYQRYLWSYITLWNQKTGISEQFCLISVVFTRGSRKDRVAKKREKERRGNFFKFLKSAKNLLPKKNILRRQMKR